MEKKVNLKNIDSDIILPSTSANTQPTYDGKVHWVVLRVNKDKSAKLMSDVGTEG